MAYTPAEHLTGINPNTAFLMRLDTQQRMNRVFSRMQTPIKYDIPNFTTPYDVNKGLSQPEIFNVNDKDLLKKAIDSDDSAVRDRAYDAIVRGSSSQAINAGVGRTNIIPYYAWQDKYINDEYGYNPNLSQEGNEQYYYQNQWQTKSPTGKLLSTTGKFVGRTVPAAVLKLVQGFGYIGAMAIGGLEQLSDVTGNWMGDEDHNFMKTVADNSLSRVMLEYEEKLKNSGSLSVYKPIDWANKSFIEKMTNGALWSDEFADGVSFLLSAAIPGTLIGKAGRGISLLANEAKYWNQAMRFLGTETLGDIGSVVYNTVSESAIEAADGFRAYKQELLRAREEGKNTYTDATIDMMAGDAAASRFKYNLAILSASNLFENKWFFKPIANRLSGVTAPVGGRVGAYGAIDEATKVTETKAAKGLFNKFMGRREGTPLNGWARIPFYGSRFLKASFMEGLWEENAQLAAERWSTQAPYTNTKGDVIIPQRAFWRQYLKQTQAAFQGKDRENEDSIGLGAMIGIFGGGAITKAFGGHDAAGNFKFWRGERKTQIQSAKDSIVRYDQARENMLSVNDIYDIDDKGVKTVNEDKVNKKLTALRDLGFHQLTANDIKDDELRKKLQKDLFASYVAASVKAGVHNGLIARLKNLPSVPQDRLQELGFDPKTVFNSPQEYTDRAEKLVKEYQTIQESRTEKPKGMSFKDYETKDTHRKFLAYMAYARALSSRDTADSYKSQMREAEATMKEVFSPLSKDYPVHMARVNEFNNLSQEEISIRQAMEELSFFDNKTVDKKLNQRLAEITRQKKDILIGINAIDETKNRVAEITDQGTTFLVDTRLDKLVGDLNDRVTAFGTKFAQMSVDEAVNQTVYENLTDTKGGINNLDAYEKHLEYLGKRNVAENEANVTPDPDIDKAKEEVVQQRSDNIQEILGLTPPIAPEEKVPEDLAAIFKESDDLFTAIAEAKAEEAPVVEEVPEEEEEDDRVFVEYDGVKYYNMLDLMDANIDEDTFQELLAQFTKLGLEKIHEKGIGEEPKSEAQLNDEQEFKEEELENERYVQGDEANTTNTLEGMEFHALAYETPIKTANREADDEHPDTEILNAQTYTQMLSHSINKAINTDIYEPIFVKDREEWLNRFPKEHADKIKAEDLIGMVLVFRKRGTQNEFLTVDEHLPGQFSKYKDRVIVHSIEDPHTPVGFNISISERAAIKAQKYRMPISEVMEQYRQDQHNLNIVRAKIISGELTEQPVELFYGGDGIVPTTGRAANVKERFNGYGVEFAVVTTENIDEFPGAREGYLVAHFPEHTSNKSMTKHFQVFAPSVFLIDTIKDDHPDSQALALKIKDIVDKIITGKIKYNTYAEAKNTIRVFLEKIVYTRSDVATFKIAKDGDKYVVNYIKKNDKGEEIITTALGSTRLNVNNKIFVGQEYLQIPLEDGTLEQVPTAAYKRFIEDRMRTYRKVVKDGNNVYLDPVNAYYNITLLEATPQEVVLQEVATEPVEDLAVPKEEAPSKSLEEAIERARETLKEEPTVFSKYALGDIVIDLKNGTYSYNGTKKPEIIEKNIERFLETAKKMQESDANIVFGERDTKKGKIYFFGNKEIGTFVIFDNKLNEVKNMEKFAKENPALLEEIKNQCK